MNALPLLHGSTLTSKGPAAHRLPNGIRIELAEQGTQVTGLFVGSTDTDMMAGFDVERNRPEDVVRTALDGLEAGLLEVLADEASINVKAALAPDPAILYPGAVRSA